jgi:tRNA modification GTPase
MQAEAVADLIRCRNTTAGESGIRSAGGHAHARDCRIEARLFDLIARLEASSIFQTRAITSSSQARWRGRSDDLWRRPARCSPALDAGRLIREGLQVAIVGNPNVGKSSLFKRAAWRRPRHRDGSAGTTTRPRHVRCWISTAFA